MRIAIIGGGAAGFFCAANLHNSAGKHEVHIFEKTQKLLTKVLVSGGGRCNVTHHCFQAKPLSKHYPRGEKFLAKAFESFQAKDMCKWLTDKGVDIKTEKDGRIFPQSDNSETIAQTLYQAALENHCQIYKAYALENLQQQDDDKWHLSFKNQEQGIYDMVLIACGGFSKMDSYSFLKNTGHEIIAPVPSLFTFHIHDKNLQALSGVSSAAVSCKIAGQKISSSGPLLITHWGVSGPAILKLSSLSARLLHDLNYTFSLIINWTENLNEQETINLLNETAGNQGLKKLINACPLDLSGRLWHYILQKSEIAENDRWIDLSKKKTNKLVQNLYACQFDVNGKSTFKEEFVSAGGVNLDEVTVQSMESKLCKNLYFAGEILNIDGITGGFNFQSAWTCSWIAAQDINIKLK